MIEKISAMDGSKINNHVNIKITGTCNFCTHLSITLNNMINYMYNSLRMHLFLCHCLLTNMDFLIQKMNWIVTNRCKMLWPFSSEHLLAALQESALVGYDCEWLVPFRMSPGKHVQVLWLCNPSSSVHPSFHPLIKIIVLLRNKLVYVIIFTCNIFISI